MKFFETKIISEKRAYMKKLKSFLVMMAMLTVLTGCNNPYQEQATTENLDAKYENHSNVITLSAAAEISDSKYTITDLKNLQDFLLTRPTQEDLRGKPYDLNNDGIWNIFDLCLMKRELLGNMVSDDIPVVYMTKDISSAGLMNTYLALEWNPSGNTAVKLSTGEPPASNYLQPELIKDVVQYVDGTIVECNTAYGGKRSSTAMHYQVAEDHGFTEIADVKILDEDGSLVIPVDGGTQLTENYVGSAFSDYDSYLVLSHFKGHAMAGFGGALKNISIGLGSTEGKCLIHTAGNSHTSPWGGDQDAFTESMAEAGKAVSDYLDNGNNIAYINVMNRLSVDCDCNGRPAEPDMHDIGILASTDPVALDQACIDLVYSAENGVALIQRIESRNGIHVLEHAEEIGLGSREYQLVILDE